MKLYVCWGTFQTPRPSGHPCHNAHEALKQAGWDPEVQKTYGWAALHPIDPRIVAGSYLAGLRNSPGVRRDFARMLRAADARDTLNAAELLRRFDKPALVAWAAEDRFFPREHGRRGADRVPLPLLLGDPRLHLEHLLERLAAPPCGRAQHEIGGVGFRLISGGR